MITFTDPRDSSDPADRELESSADGLEDFDWEYFDAPSGAVVDASPDSPDTEIAT